MGNSNMWKLTENGFIGQYLIAGPVLKDLTSNESAMDQLSLEGILRGQLCPEGEPADCENADWKVYAPCNGDMIDVSAFYSTLQAVSFLARTNLYVSEDVTVKARLWTYMAVSLFCNKEKVGRVDRAVYKPIQYLDVELSLQKGKNTVYALCRNLGVRDTRNILGLQLLEDEAGKVEIALFEGEAQERLFRAWNYLRSLRISSSRILTELAKPEGAYMTEVPEEYDYEIISRYTEKKVPVGDFTCAVVKVGVEDPLFTLERTLEDTEKRKPSYDRDVFLATAEITSNDRGGFGFSMPNILARLELGRADLSKKGLDRRLLYTTLDLIEKRVDCADFELCGLFRLIHLHGDLLDEALMGRIKEVILGFRYWMDMKGSDAMCFWSENHSLMFYMCAYEAGRMYPEEYFPLAEMTGEKLHAFGRKNMEAWLKDVREYGFEEFLSSVYLNVTFAVLLNVVDFTEDALSKSARMILDQMFLDVAKHCFKHCMIAPMGRVYRSNIYPFLQGIQETIRMFEKSAPGAYGEGWGAFLHGSTYRFPEALKSKMDSDQNLTYETGNAQITLKKTSDYCLTSVQSPSSLGTRRWENLRLKALAHEVEESVTKDPAYTKSLNESFHGTSCFEPGTYGYQQHMWYAALSPEAVVFINHPGVSNEASDMRPGYWFGNGVMPAIKQKENLLGGIYRIPEDHPVAFVHLYLPEKRFDEVITEGRWIFLRKDHGYMAIWGSEPFHRYSDRIFDCELRVYSRDSAYVIICGSQKQEGSFEAFCRNAVMRMPEYDENTGRLYVSGKEYMKYTPGTDRTQFVE